MVSARSFVVVMIIHYKVWRALWQRIDYAALSCAFAALVVFRSLSVNGKTRLMTGVLIIGRIGVAVARVRDILPIRTGKDADPDIASNSRMGC